jgi:hypothetical protein
MAWRPQPRRIRLNGTDAVLLSPDDYDRLDTIRRQAGAQASRIHALREQLADATATLDTIRQAAGRADRAQRGRIMHELLLRKREARPCLGASILVPRHRRGHDR